MKRLLKVVLSVFLIIIVILGIAFIDFFPWRRDIIERIETDPHRHIVTTVLGDIEYGVEGEGVPLLVLHGSISGYDGGLKLVNNIPNVKIIAVSRPGYLGTPLSSGRTPEEQSDLYAALLEKLDIERVIVLAASSGGPFGIQFALRHPDRISGLILASTSLKPETENKSDIPSLGKSVLLIGDMYMWVAAKFFPSLVINTLTDNYDKKDPAQSAQVKTIVETVVPMAARWSGNINDAAQLSNATINDWPFGEVSVPTLIIHGDADPLVPYKNALYSVEQIPHSRLVAIKGGGHFGYNEEQLEQYTAAVTSFIQSIMNDTDE